MPDEMEWRRFFSVVEDAVRSPRRVTSKLLLVGPVEVPGIAAADALDANDALGTEFKVRVPRWGTIVNAFYHDLDDEGTAVELWIFRHTFTDAASDAAFSLVDIDNLFVAGVFLFDRFADAANNQVGLTKDTPLWYVAPEGYLYCQVKTTSTPTIAAAQSPQVSFIIDSSDPDF